MADPISLTALTAAGASGGGISSILGLVGMGATAAGGLVNAYGTKESADSAAAQATYQAGVAALRQQVDTQNANYALNVGEGQAQQAGMKGREIIGQEKAGAAARGLDVNSGSAAATRGSEEEITQQNEAVIRADAMKKAYNFQVQGVEDTATQQLDLMGASKDITAGDIGFTGSLLGTAGSVASQWYKYGANFGGSTGDNASGSRGITNG